MITVGIGLGGYDASDLFAKRYIHAGSCSRHVEKDTALEMAALILNPQRPTGRRDLGNALSRLGLASAQRRGPACGHNSASVTMPCHALSASSTDGHSKGHRAMHRVIPDVAHRGDLLHNTFCCPLPGACAASLR